VSASAASKQLACTPTYLRFGGTVVGQTETLLVNLTNNGQTSVTISGVTVNNSKFTTSYLSLPLVLPAGQSVGLSVSFSPTAIGWTEGTVDISSNASNAALQFEVRGTGVSSEPCRQPLDCVIWPSAARNRIHRTCRAYEHSFPECDPLGTPDTGAGFSMSGLTFPLTLGAGQSVTLSVAFSPQSAGTVGGNLFISNTGAALVIPLTVLAQLPVNLPPILRVWPLAAYNRGQHDFNRFAHEHGPDERDDLAGHRYRDGISVLAG